jgi:hypothetical protein
MIDPAERRASVAVHAAGLLGVTVVGWLPAALLSGLALSRAVAARSALRTLQAAQAALFQLAALAGHVLLIGLSALGFIAFGGDLPILPEAAFYVDPTTAGGLAALVLWGLCVAAVPVWHVLTLVLALRAARRSAAGVLYAYPVVGPFVWDSAPDYLPWLRIEGGETAGDETNGEPAAGDGTAG